jgi:sorting nexin-3/12
MAAAVSPFARSSAFEESLLSAREQTVSNLLPFLIEE